MHLPPLLEGTGRLHIFFLLYESTGNPGVKNAYTPNMDISFSYIYQKVTLLNNLNGHFQFTF